MYPELFSIGHFTLHSYGLVMAIALISGYYFLLKTSKLRELSEKFISYLFTGAVIWGIVGARMFYVLISLESFIHFPLKVFAVWEGGLVFSGGLIGGIIWAVYASKKRKVKFLDTADVTVPALALGHAIQRMGCFLSGDSYGRITDSWVGVVFPRGSHAHYEQVRRGIVDISQSPLAVHPAQLYSLVGVGIISFILYRVLKSDRTKNGSVFALYLSLYGIFRVGIEYLRGDFRGAHILFFTPTQWVAAAATAAGLFIFYKRRGNERLK